MFLISLIFLPQTLHGLYTQAQPCCGRVFSSKRGLHYKAPAAWFHTQEAKLRILSTTAARFDAQETEVRNL